MEPLNPYLKEGERIHPSTDAIFYECNSIADYLQGIKNEEEYPQGEQDRLVAIIRGRYILTIETVTSRILESLSQVASILEKEYESIGLAKAQEVMDTISSNPNAFDSTGVYGSLTEPFLEEGDPARVFILKPAYENLRIPDTKSSIEVFDPILVYESTEAELLKVEGFYGRDLGDYGWKGWQPTKPIVPRGFEPVS